MRVLNLHKSAKFGCFITINDKTVNNLPRWGRFQPNFWCPLAANLLTGPKIGMICICAPLFKFFSAPPDGTTTHSLTHCCAWPAEDRSVLHIERSWLAIWAAPTDRPMSSSTCCSQVLRGRPGGRFQSVAGGVPVWTLDSYSDSCSACEAGVFSGRRQMWPNNEWRLSAIRDGRSGNFLLWLTTVLDILSYHLIPKIRHSAWIWKYWILSLSTLQRPHNLFISEIWPMRAWQCIKEQIQAYNFKTFLDLDAEYRSRWKSKTKLYLITMLFLLWSVVTFTKLCKIFLTIDLIVILYFCATSAVMYVVPKCVTNCQLMLTE